MIKYQTALPLKNQSSSPPPPHTSALLLANISLQPLSVGLCICQTSSSLSFLQVLNGGYTLPLGYWYEPAIRLFQSYSSMCHFPFAWWRGGPIDGNVGHVMVWSYLCSSRTMFLKPTPKATDCVFMSLSVKRMYLNCVMCWWNNK